MWPVLFYRAVQPCILPKRLFHAILLFYWENNTNISISFHALFSMVKSSVINYKYFMCINVISIKGSFKKKKKDFSFTNFLNNLLWLIYGSDVYYNNKPQPLGQLKHAFLPGPF